MRTTADDVGRESPQPSRMSITRISVYFLTLAICVPTDLNISAINERPLLVPFATFLVLLVWIVLQRGRLVAVHGALGLIWRALILFIAVTVLSALIHPNAAASMAVLGAYVDRFVMLFVLVQIMALDYQLIVRVQHLLASILAVVALLMISNIFGVFGGLQQFTKVAGRLVNRDVSGLGDPNFTALIFNIGLAMALAWFATAESRWRRVMATVVALLLMAGVAKTVSIGGLVGLVVVLVLGFWRIARFASHRRWGVTLLTVGLLAAIVAMAGSFYSLRIQQQIAASEQSVGNFGSSRLNLSIGGLRMIAANPLLGVGLSNVAEYMPQYLLFPIYNPQQGAHDCFISVMAESGIPSFLLLGFVGIMLFKLVVRTQRHLKKTGNRYWYLIGEGTWIALLATLVQALALETQREPTVWLTVALALSLATKVQYDQTLSSRLDLLSS